MEFEGSFGGFFCSMSSFKAIECSFVPKTDISFSTI